MGNKVRFYHRPKRIISLVPSITQFLHHIGLEEEVVGITRFCILPEEWHKTKKNIGGTKGLKMDEIKKLEPDLIIGCKEENLEWEIKEL